MYAQYVDMHGNLIITKINIIKRHLPDVGQKQGQKNL